MDLFVGKVDAISINRGITVLFRQNDQSAVKREEIHRFKQKVGVLE